MTVRAVLIGAIIGLFIAAFGYVNDWVLKLPYVASDLMPVSVFGLLVVGLVVANPVLYLLGRRHLRGSEWAVIYSLMLVACVIPGPGLLWQYHNALIMPVQEQRQRPGWRASEHPPLLNYVPEFMLVKGARRMGIPEALPAEPEEDSDTIVTGFVQGLGRPGKALAVSEVPWRAWAQPMSFYMPVIVLGFVGSVCLSLIVHRQWAYREHLRYPMAEVASELLGTDASGWFSPIFRNRLFWGGFAIALGVLVVNGTAAYKPGFISIPTNVDFTAVAQAWPKITRVQFYADLLNPRFFFAVVGLAFLISSEVSFSLGISHMAYAFLFLVLTDFGVDMANDYMSGGVMTYQLFGSYLGGGVVILYAGRKFYWAVLKRSLGGSTAEPVERHVTWACRILLLCVAGMIAILNLVVGLDLLMATLFVMMLGLTFLIVTRINVETGVLFVQPNWQAVAILTGLFGIHALGPRTMIILGLLCVVLTIDPRVCLMPLVANAFKVADSQRVRLPSLTAWIVVLLVVGLAVAVPVTLWVQYDLGGAQLYGWANTAALLPFEMLKRNVDRLQAWWALDTAGEADGWGGLERFTQMSASPKFLWSAGMGLAVILVCTAARLRWTWWPIHPVMFMVWGTIISRWFAASFLAGWLLKVAITRFRGSASYRGARPFFIGMIAGEMVAGIIWMIVGGSYYAYYGAAGPMFHVHP